MPIFNPATTGLRSLKTPYVSNSASKVVPDDSLKSLTTLYASNPAAKAVLDEFASRQRSQQVTTLDQLLLRLNDSGVGVARADVIGVLRKLAELGYGYFITGRRGHRTRFEWKYDLVSVGNAASGGTQVVEKIQPGSAQDNDDDDFPAALSAGSVAETTPEGAIRHTFQLRPDWQIELTLPADLSVREASRLSEFVKTLPFDAQP